MSLLHHFNPQLAEGLLDLVLVLLFGDLPMLSRQHDIQPVEFVLEQVHHPHQAGDLALGHGELQPEPPPGKRRHAPATSCAGTLRCPPNARKATLLCRYVRHCWGAVGCTPRFCRPLGLADLGQDDNLAARQPDKRLFLLPEVTTYGPAFLQRP